MSRKPNLNQRRRMEDLVKGDGMIITGGKIPISIPIAGNEELREETSHDSHVASPPIATNLGSIVAKMRGYDIERGGGF